MHLWPNKKSRPINTNTKSNSSLSVKPLSHTHTPSNQISLQISVAAVDVSHPLLLRRNSSSSVVFEPNHHSTATIFSTSFPSHDLELMSIKPASHSYSSLKDLLPSVGVNSPKPKSALARPDIRIRNRLVKQAAWAYLRPMSTSTDFAGGNFIQRLWSGVAAFIDFVCSNIIRAFDGSLRASRIRSSRLQRSKMCFV